MVIDNQDRIHYVVGFMFSSDKTLVTLIRKNRPKWMNGKLNGVGGKIEIGETPLQAMVRIQGRDWISHSTRRMETVCKVIWQTRIY